MSHVTKPNDEKKGRDLGKENIDKLNRGALAVITWYLDIMQKNGRYTDSFFI